MSIELSVSQERRLHTILDRGLEALSENSERNNVSCPVISNSQLKFSDKPSTEIGLSLEGTEKQGKIQAELKALQEKLSFLEDRFANRQNSSQSKSPRSKFKLSLNSSSRNSPHHRGSPKEFTKNRVKTLENSEKELKRLEGILSKSPSTTKRINNKLSEKIKEPSDKDKRIVENLKKENEALKKELQKRDNGLKELVKLKEEFNELTTAFERSETVRKKQKELISQLKSELKSLSAPANSSTKKLKKTKH